MIFRTKLIGAIAAALLLMLPSLPSHAATACTLADLTQYMAQCFDPKIELSTYQKMGQAEIIEGRFCNDSGLIADGAGRRGVGRQRRQHQQQRGCNGA